MDYVSANRDHLLLDLLECKTGIIDMDFAAYYSEWNNSPSPRDSYHDTSYNAAFIVKTLTDNMGLVDVYSFWTFSDIFEECGISSQVLIKASELAAETVDCMTDGEGIAFELIIQPHSALAISLIPEY